MSCSQVPVVSRVLSNRQSSMELPSSCTVSTTSTHAIDGVAKEGLLEPLSYSPTLSVLSFAPDTHKKIVHSVSPQPSTATELYLSENGVESSGPLLSRRHGSQTGVSSESVMSCDAMQDVQFSRPGSCSSSSSVVSSFSPCLEGDDAVRQPCSTPDLWDAMSSLVDEYDSDQTGADDAARYDVPHDVGVVSWDCMDRLMRTHEYGAWESR